MTTFDGWETQFYGCCPDNGQDSLAHFRTKGSKNGVRRYQNTDGTWTPLGLRERKAREGWGSEERKQRRAEKKAARSEARAAKKQAKAERMAQFRETQRKKHLKTMTDEELKASINRMKLEQEYRELHKSPFLKLGEKFVEKQFELQAKREQRAEDKIVREHEMKKLQEQTKQAEIRKEETLARSEADKAKAAADQARAETDKIDIESGTRKRSLKLDTLKAKSALTVGGGIKKAINNILTSEAQSYGRYAESRSTARGVKKSHKIVSRYNKFHRNDPNYAPLDYDPNPWDKKKKR